MDKNEEYKQMITGVFSRTSSNYSQVGPNFFPYFGGRLVEAADVSEGATVLDVACGRGAVLFPLLKAVGKSGRVTGIDLADGMVAELSKAVSDQGISNAQVLKMDAEKLDFPNESFDYLLSGFSFFFYPNLDLALSEFLRVLKPGGQMATSTFDKLEVEMREDFDNLTEAYQSDLKPIPVAERNMLDSVEEIENVFAKAGFINIECRSETKTFYFNDEAEWWQAQWSNGRRSLLERMSEEVLARYHADSSKILQRYKTEKGIPAEYSIILSKAIKPGVS